jgi:FkbM family methyltransferase
MIKKLILSILGKMGYSLSKAPIIVKGIKVDFNFFAKHQWLTQFQFHTILDIGANTGQFASKIRLLFPDAFIYSFEPIPEIFDILSMRFSKDLKLKAFNFGLGMETGKFDFFQNDFSDSSSLKAMKELHKKSFPQTRNEKKIQVDVESLDKISDTLNLDLPMLIKIDVQGFERQVILGGMNTIQKASVLIVEVSFYDLYEDQEYFDSIYSLLFGLGFKYMGNYDQLISPKDGSILQADALFIKSDGETN